MFIPDLDTDFFHQKPGSDPDKDPPKKPGVESGSGLSFE
jgi:hypothetical protein